MKLKTLLSRIYNGTRLLFANAKHRRRVYQSRKLLFKLNEIERERGGGAVIAYLRKTDPYLFEEVILTSFESKGWIVKRGLSYSGDGGIDGQVRHQGAWYPIQAKRYSNYIQPKHVKDFDVLLEQRGQRGFFVHTAKTGSKSRESYCPKRMKIFSGSKLLDLLRV